jgi:hypothetical protein
MNCSGFLCSITIFAIRNNPLKHYDYATKKIEDSEEKNKP